MFLNYCAQSNALPFNASDHLNVIIMSLMLSKKAGYHKTYSLSAIILKDLVSPLSDTGHFVIKIWGHLLDFYKTWCVCSTYGVLQPYQFWPYILISDLWMPQIYFALVQYDILSYKWAIAHHCIKTEFYQLKTWCNHVVI